MSETSPPALPSDPLVSDEVHTTSTVERGSFSSAHCSCGWRGPARRSRDLARTDARGHSPAI